MGLLSYRSKQQGSRPPLGCPLQWCLFAFRCIEYSLKEPGVGGTDIERSHAILHMQISMQSHKLAWSPPRQQMKQKTGQVSRARGLFMLLRKGPSETPGSRGCCISFFYFPVSKNAPQLLCPWADRFCHTE